MTAAEPTLLIVDDIEDNRAALAMRLDLAGYSKFISVGDGLAALEALRAQTIDLVLLDIMMPGMDGYQVLEEMKADPHLRDVPVIVISALGDVENVVRSIELGAADYLMKPFNPVILKARIDTYLERARLKAQEFAYYEQIAQEKERADNLLAQLLPQQIATILKANDRLPPIRYDNVAVLFCDVIGFTAYSESHPPEIVFEQLETLIEDFEKVLDDHGLMKIKTIGDAILATAGLLTPSGDPVAEATRAALQMLETSQAHVAGWKVRVGIDHGPVVAGTIGRQQFQFDIWGDTVNTAARIETVAEAGTVCLSGRAWHAIHDRAQGRSLGLVDLKGKEPIEVLRCVALR